MFWDMGTMYPRQIDRSREGRYDEAAHGTHGPPPRPRSRNCGPPSLVGCARTGIEHLVGEELFSLSLGRLEDQIDLFQPEGMTMDRTNRIAMRDGLFYVANGNAGKIMIFTSYGDLIFLLYNPKTNPRPSCSVRPGPMVRRRPPHPTRPRAR